MLRAIQPLIDDLPEQIALLTESCAIVAANRAWLETTESVGFECLVPGRDLRAICEKQAAAGYVPASMMLAALAEIVHGRRDAWQMMFEGLGPSRAHAYQVRLHRLSFGDKPFITITCIDLAARNELSRLRADFNNSLMQGQAAERGRLARELHDSTSQLLAGIGLLVGGLKAQATPGSLEIVNEVQRLLAEIHREIRSIAYLALPPSLERMRFPEALTRLAEGFGDRCGLAVSVNFEGTFRPASPHLLNALYRVVQEALANIHWHAHASRVDVSVCVRPGITHIIVADNGIGMDPRAPGGAGLAGMRARIAEFGGRLSIRALSPGTAIIASVP